MQDYRVELDTFSGPLDLLLFLVKRDEIDLLDISVARLTEQYLAYLKQLQQIDVNLAGEFLVMAATLLELKSQILVPQAPPSDDSAATPQPVEAFDPRMELVQSLLAYKRFKDAAFMLENRCDQWAQRYPRRSAFVRSQAAADLAATQAQQALLWSQINSSDPNAPIPEDDSLDTSADLRDFDLEDANILDLAQAFARLMESVGTTPGRHEVVYDDTPLELHATDILDRLSREGNICLEKIFEGRHRSERIGLFLAMLELTRQRKILIQQEDLASPIQVQIRPAADPSTEIDSSPSISTQSDSVSPDTQPAQPDYEWPDEASRLAAQRRAKLRLHWAQKKKSALAESDAESDSSVDFIDSDSSEVDPVDSLNLADDSSTDESSSASLS